MIAQYMRKMLRTGWDVPLHLMPIVHKSKMAQFSEIANHAWKMGGGWMEGRRIFVGVDLHQWTESA